MSTNPNEMVNEKSVNREIVDAKKCLSKSGDKKLWW
jgi:hypothetical protein